jgi:hypothetical protein
MAVEVLAFLPGLLLLVLANYTEKRKELRILTQIFLGLSIVLVILTGAASAMLTGDESPGLKNAPLYGYIIVLTGLASLLFFLRPVRAALAKVINIRPDNWLHATCLVFAMLLIGMSLATAAAFDVISLSKTAGTGPESIVIQDAFFVLLALFGVGWLTRRKWKAVLKRLDLRVPKPKEVGWSLVFLALIFAVIIAIGLAEKAAKGGSNLLETNEDPTIQILGAITVVTAIIYSLGAGIGEEILFRGAAQPMFGIALTSALFAIMHIQYFDVLSMSMLFIISVILGYERKFAGTVGCIITHTLYNLILFLSVV